VGRSSTTLILKPFVDAGNELGLEFAALSRCNTVSPRDAEFHGCFQHGQILRRGLLHDARSQLFSDADLPRRAGGDLFTGDEAFGQPTMDVEVSCPDLGGLADRDDVALRRLRRGLEAGYAAITAQTADLIGREAFSARVLRLMIQDALR